MVIRRDVRAIARSGFNTRFLTGLLLIGLGAGCGGGGGGGDGGSGAGGNNADGGASLARSTTAETLPNAAIGPVSGVYTFATERVSGACTDGARINANGIALQILVIEDAGHLRLFNQSATPVVGVEVIEDARLEGTVQPNGVFAAGSRVLARLDGIPGTAELLYSLEGRFTQNGWSGVYEYALISPDLNVTCFYQSDFRGTKLNATGGGLPDASGEAGPLQASERWAPQDVYDSQGLIGMNP